MICIYLDKYKQRDSNRRENLKFINFKIQLYVFKSASQVYWWGYNYI